MKSHLPLAALWAFVALFCSLLVIVPTSCSGTDCKDPKNAGSACTVETAALDCAGGSILGAIALWGPEIEQGIEALRGADGQINWTAAEPVMIQDAYKYGSCVAGAVFGQYFAPTPLVEVAAGAGSGSGSSTAGPTLKPRASTSPQDVAAAKAAFEHVRTKAMGNHKLHYAGGVL